MSIQDLSQDSNRLEVFLRLFTPHNRHIFHFILSMIPNWSDAQDVMQETSRVLWEKFDEFELGTDFLAWALTIAKYQTLNYRKKRRRGGILLEDMAEVFLNDQQQHQDSMADKISALRVCLSKLNPSDRKHIQLRFQEERSPKHMAQDLGVTVKRIYRTEGRIMGLLLRCIRRRLFAEGVLG